MNSNITEEFNNLVKTCAGKDQALWFLEPYETLLKFNECQDLGLNCIDKEIDLIDKLKNWIVGTYGESQEQLGYVIFDRQQNHDIVELLDELDVSLGLKTDGEWYIPPLHDEFGFADVRDKEYAADQLGIDENRIDEIDWVEESESQGSKRYDRFQDKLSDIKDSKLLILMFDKMVNTLHSGGNVIIDYVFGGNIQGQMQDDVDDVDFDIYFNIVESISELLNTLGTGKITNSDDIITLKKCASDILCTDKTIEKNAWDNCLENKRNKSLRPMDVRRFR